MIRKFSWVFALILALSIIGTAFAHGVVIEHRLFAEDGVIKIEIHANFDSGEPMADGQVAIFAPNDLANPWQTGQMDANGSFTFEPDLSIPGTWDVQVRKAGHGDMVHIKLTGEELQLLDAGTGQSGSEIKGPKNEIEQPAGKTPATVSEQVSVMPETAGESVSIVSGEREAGGAPLVQIIVNDGNVIVADGHTPLSVQNTPAAFAVSGYSTAQIIVMAICVIWGFVGTALFFVSRGR